MMLYKSWVLQKNEEKKKNSHAGDSTKERVFWPKETKLELSGPGTMHYVWPKPNTHENTMPRVKHGGDSIIIFF